MGEDDPLSVVLASQIARGRIKRRPSQIPRVDSVWPSRPRFVQDVEHAGLERDIERDLNAAQFQCSQTGVYGSRMRSGGVRGALDDSGRLRTDQ